MVNFFSEYFAELNELLMSYNEEKLDNCVNLIQQVERNKKKILIFGNGGSAAIASHVAVDLTKVGGVRALNFNEGALLTCFGNDFGYERWVEKAIEFYIDDGDLGILISSSGQSQNMILGAKRLAELGNKFITLSGFHSDNPLRKCGDISLYVNSSTYNLVENTHQMWLLAIMDKFLKQKEKNL